MKRVAFAILAGFSLLLALAVAAAWGLSYYRPSSAVVQSSGENAMPPTPLPSSTSSATIVENRAGHVIFLTQWMTLQRGDGDPPLTFIDATKEPRSVRLVARSPYVHPPRVDSSTVNIEWGLSVPDILRFMPSDALGILLWRAGFAYSSEDPGPVRLVVIPGERPVLQEMRVADVPIGHAPSLRLSGYRYQVVGYRQLMFPHWFLVLLGLLIPLLWVYANRRSVRWARQGRCTRCGYDLRATPERCPECGHAL